MVDSVGFSGGIGSSGLAAFDLGGIAPNGGGPAPSGIGDLGAAGLSPIGSSGLSPFGLSGPIGMEAAKAQQYNTLVGQMDSLLKGIAADNAAAIGRPGPAPQAEAPGFQPPAYTPPSFTSQLTDPFALALPAERPAMTLPAGIDELQAPSFLAAPIVGPGAQAFAAGAFASPVMTPAIDAPAATDPFAPIEQGGLGLAPITPPGPYGFAAMPGSALMGDALTYRANLLPVGRTAAGELVPAWPAALKGIYDGVSYFGQAMRGEAPVFDPATGHVSDEAIGHSFALAGLGMTGGFAGMSPGAFTVKPGVGVVAAESAVVGEGGLAGRQVLYHYTNEVGMTGIVESNSLNPSLWRVGTKDVRYGNGQYVSDFAPGTKTPAQLSREFLGRPFHGDRFTHYIEIDATGLGAIQGRLGAYVIPNEIPLDLTDKVLSNGKVPLR